MGREIGSATAVAGCCWSAPVPAVSQNDETNKYKQNSSMLPAVHGTCNRKSCTFRQRGRSSSSVARLSLGNRADTTAAIYHIKHKNGIKEADPVQLQNSAN